MFLNGLNTNQRKSFLALATKLAVADGQISSGEIPLLRELGDAFGHDLEFSVEEIHNTINTKPFDTRKARVLALTGVFVMAYVDNHLDAEESKVLDEIVDTFGFGTDEIDFIKDWAQKEAELYNQLKSFYTV